MPRVSARLGQPVLSEKQFQQQVTDLAHHLGYRTYHTWNSIHSSRGFPDLVMARPPRLIFAELKSAKGQVSLAQQGWLDDLRASGVEAYLWRPSDFEEIVKILS